MRYTLLLNSGPPPAEVTEADFAAMQQAFDAYGKALAEAGVLVGASVLQGPDVATTVTLRGGSAEIADGPFAETKEALAGVFLIDVPDLDAALDWAKKCPGATYGVIEVRPSATSLLADGTWT
ncbi:MAG: YciI family protein [Propionibacteriales bacterium]|nr:YciI family protein [Propionibacteriales bacterium]